MHLCTLNLPSMDNRVYKSLKGKRQAHPWYNENGKERKTELNRAKKLFRQNNTPRNLQLLKECEEAYEQECEKAKTEWVNMTCEKIDTCTDPKEKWQSFRKLTSYRERSNVDVLPLHNEKEVVVFAHQEKCKILQNTFFGGSHIANQVFDEDFKKEIEQILLSIRQEVCSEDGDAFLNRPISYDEVEASIQRMQKNKAPGPHNIFTNMLLKANETVIQAVTILIQKSWNAKKLPKIWKRANVKFLMKPGKDSYYNGSSYRPISLTSVLGKCMERIIHARLYAYAEHHKILDIEQDGFRKYRGTTQSLLRFTQTVSTGFSENKATLAIFIDMEKAFDSVWKDGLLVKLYERGVNGTLW